MSCVSWRLEGGRGAAAAPRGLKASKNLAFAELRMSHTATNDAYHTSHQPSPSSTKGKCLHTISLQFCSRGGSQEEELAAMEANQNQITELQARLAKLEATESNRILQLEATVTSLEATVTSLEATVSDLARDLVTAEDEGVYPGTSISPTLYAARNGLTAVLEKRLSRGADPNQDDGEGNTCLIASASYGKPECTRLLIQAGADVHYVYSGTSVLWTLARCFSVREGAQDTYRPGDYILTADLLVEAGAPVDELLQDDETMERTALGLLYSMEVDEETQDGRERRGLIAVLERRYWQQHGGQNPFLRGISPTDMAWHLLMGAANDEAGRVDISKVRSIKPSLRQNVLNLLVQCKGMREMLAPILVTMKHASSPLGLFLGHEASILPLIAAFAGATGWSLATCVEAINALQETIEYHQTDDTLYEDDEDSNDGMEDVDLPDYW